MPAIIHQEVVVAVPFTHCNYRLGLNKEWQPHMISCCLTFADCNHLRLIAAVQFRQPGG